MLESHIQIPDLLPILEQTMKRKLVLPQRKISDPEELGSIVQTVNGFIFDTFLIKVAEVRFLHRYCLLKRGYKKIFSFITATIFESGFYFPIIFC